MSLNISGSLALRMILRNWFFIGLVTLASIFITSYTYTAITPLYSSRGVLSFDAPKFNIPEIQTQQGAIDVSGEKLRSEIWIIQSTTILEPVVRRLELHRNLYFFNAEEYYRKNISLTPEQSIRAAVETLRKELSVFNDVKSYVILLDTKTPDPTLSADIINNIMNEYLVYKQRLKGSGLEGAVSVLRKQKDQLADEIKEIEEKIAALKAGSNQAETQQGLLITQDLLRLYSEKEAAIAEIESLKSRITAGENALKNSSSAGFIAAFNSEVLVNLEQQRGLLKEELFKLNTRYGERHPEILKINEQLERIDTVIVENATQILTTAKGSLERAQGRLSRASSRISELEQQSSVASKDRLQALRLESDLKSKQEQLARYEERIIQASFSGKNSDELEMSIAVKAEPAINQSYPQLKLFVGGGATIGLMLGLTTSLIFGLIRNRIYEIEEIENATGLNIMSVIPKIKPSKNGASLSDLVINEPQHPICESLRTVTVKLNNNLVSDQQKAANIVLITSPNQGDGKTEICLSLGRIFSMDGQSTTIIDCDLRLPDYLRCNDLEKIPYGHMPHGEAELIQRIGLGKFRDNKTGLIVYTREQKVGGLELWKAYKDIRELIQLIETIYQTIIIDTPPVLYTPDAEAFSDLASQRVMVFSAHKLDYHMVKSAIKRFNQFPITGAIVNRVTMKRKTMQKYYYKEYKR